MHVFRIGNTQWSVGSSQSLIGDKKNGAVLKEPFVHSCNCFRPVGEKKSINGIRIKRFSADNKIWITKVLGDFQ